MKRAGILGLAIALTLGLGAGASQAAKPKKVKTEPEIEGFRTFPGNQSEFFGDVHSKKSKCEKRREVTLVYTGPGPGTGPVFDVTETDGTGDWVVDPAPFAVQQGDYIVEIARKRVGAGDKRLTCKAATSPPKFISEL
jgi:hypothetical protein